MTEKTITAFIFARGGSKGVKDKNIRDLAGKPLIAHAIESTLASKYIARVVVSTDSERIAAVAREYGAEVLMRPAALAEDTSSELLAWRHAIASFPQYFSDEEPVFISTPATSPMRITQDVDMALERFAKGDADIVIGVSPSHRNPYLSMMVADEQNYLKVAISGSAAVNRQDAPKVFDITGSVYVSRPSYINACAKLLEGKVGYVTIPPERALDIDSEYDLHLAGLVMAKPFKG